MVDFECAKTGEIEDVCRLLRILRSEGGCPWDAEQTHTSIKDNLLEESCEAIEAIELGDSALLCEELGDVLLQVAFHSVMAEESGAFTMIDVIRNLCVKLVSRHPHVFGDLSLEGGAKDIGSVLSNWEAIKRAKKGQASVTDSMRGVAKTLPPLMRAEKLMRLAERAGQNTDNSELGAAMSAVKTAHDNLAAACELYIESCERQGNR